MGIADELKRRAEAVGGKAWGADKGKPRVYLQAGGKEVSAYFHFPKADEESLGPPEFKVFIESEPGQKIDFKAARQQYADMFRMKGLAIMAVGCGDDELATALASSPNVDDGIYEQLEKLLTAGKPADARSLLTMAEDF